MAWTFRPAPRNALMSAADQPPRPVLGLDVRSGVVQPSRVPGGDRHGRHRVGRGPAQQRDCEGCGQRHSDGARRDGFGPGGDHARRRDHRRGRRPRRCARGRFRTNPKDAWAAARGGPGDRLARSKPSDRRWGCDQRVVGLAWGAPHSDWALRSTAASRPGSAACSPWPRSSAWRPASQLAAHPANSSAVDGPARKRRQPSRKGAPGQG